MKFKNLLTTLTFSLSFVLMSFGQDYATAKTADKFVSANAKGVYNFVVPEKITQSDVDLSAEYYTVYFDVKFTPSTHEVEIKLNGIENKNKQVISRFFISLGLREIQYEGVSYPVQEFYEKFLKTVK